jgi:hypothetical protein
MDIVRDANRGTPIGVAISPRAKLQGPGRSRRRKARRGGEELIFEDEVPELTPEERIQAILGDTDKKSNINNRVRQDALHKIGKDLFSIDLPAALEQYLAAEPKAKRATRAKIRALTAVTDAKFGTQAEILEKDPETTPDIWLQPALDWFASLEEKAPELLDKGTEDTPETVYKSTPAATQNEEARQKMLADIDTAAAEAAQEEDKTALSDKEYQVALKEYEEAVDAAGDNEEARTAAVEAFNAKFPAEDPRRLQGSGKPGPTLLMRNLYLGNKDDAANKKFLRKARIRTVFNCTRNVPETKSASVKTVRFALDDSPEDVSVMKEKGAEWASQVMEAMSEGPVLIHCVEGRQRSPAIAAMVLALHKPKRGGNAMKAVRSKRPFAFTPQANFKEAIIRWLG